MNPSIMIFKLAKLMHVSVHQIRYFEENGLLPPALTGDNQYRMYGTDEMYRLAHILLLRQLDVAVPQVKRCLEHYIAADDQALLKQSTRTLEQQITDLQVQALQQRIGAIQA
ncbi:helix-turn-helix domain-containing protein [Paenibacillus wenxiniae]|uniref:MerR family transcriptional regulator n=1 Tax=Paenibacillus wenxiniae TaxID=1636843 RepID=A0ABW4RFW7_9BACL